MAISKLQFEARNISLNSGNAIHGDQAAQRFGFEGALAPGAELFGFLAVAVVSHCGPAWLERGMLRARFRRPVYEGDLVVVEAEEAEGGLDLWLVRDGTSCVEGWGGLSPPVLPPSHDGFIKAARPEHLPPADEQSLAPGVSLCVPSFPISSGDLARYLEDAGESAALFVKEDIVPPAMLLRLCNRAVSDNVAVGPWIHTASDLQNLAIARAGQPYGALARVLSNYERNGHRFVDLDVLLTANDALVARVLHSAIYKLRRTNEPS